MNKYVLTLVSFFLLTSLLAVSCTVSPAPAPAPAPAPTPTSTPVTPDAPSSQESVSATLVFTELNLTGVRTQTNVPSQIQLSFSLRDESDHAIVVPEEEIQSVTRIFEKGSATEGWDEIDYTETSFFAHTAENMQLEVVFVLDFTNSMLQAELSDGRNGIQGMLDAFKAAIYALPGAHRIGVVEFHDRNIEPSVLSELTTNRGAIISAVNKFASANYDSGSSRVWDSIEKALSLFSSRSDNPYVSRAVVFVSDGRDTSSIRSRSAIKEIAFEIGAQLYAIGVGDVFEEQALAGIVRDSGGFFYPVDEISKIQSQFKQLTDDLRGQYQVSYITLRREGLYKVKMEITLQDITGTFESSEIDVGNFFGLDTEGRIAIDPPSIDRGQGLASFYVRALHIPRNISRFRFRIDTSKTTKVDLVPKDQGGIIEGWTLLGPDSSGYYEVSSSESLTFGNFGVLFKVTMTQVTEKELVVPILFDNSIYGSGKKFVYDPYVAIGQSQILFYSDRDGDYEIYVMNADGSGIIRLTNNSAEDTNPKWSPNRSHIAYISDLEGGHNVYIMSSDGKGRKQLTLGDNDIRNIWWSPDGSKILLFYYDGDPELHVVNVDRSGEFRLTNNSANDAHPSWSPDGTKIAYRSNRDGDLEIYLAEADGSAEYKLTSNTYLDSDPCWSPDGLKIAFYSDRDGDRDIYTMNVDGSDVEKLTNNSAADHLPVEWLPNGYISFISDRTGEEQIYIMKSDGSDQKALNKINKDWSNWVWSPYGNRVAFSLPSAREEREIYVMTLADVVQISKLTDNSAQDIPSDW